MRGIAIFAQNTNSIEYPQGLGKNNIFWTKRKENRIDLSFWINFAGSKNCLIWNGAYNGRKKNRERTIVAFGGHYASIGFVGSCNTIGQPVSVQTYENVSAAPLEMDVSKLMEGQYLLRVVSQGKKDFIKQVFIVH